MQRTTLLLEDPIYFKIRQESQRTGKSLKELVNSFLREALLKITDRKPKYKFELTPRPNKPFPEIDISDRDQIYAVFDQDLKL